MKKTGPFILSFSIAIALNPLAFAGPGDLNSVNTGKTISGGIYYNTPGSHTTFINPGGSLHLQKGQLVRGLESNANKVMSGHGGTLYLRAPGNVIRLDGDIDVSAVKNGKIYTGNGGKLFLDSAYLFQTGNIHANGYNGGIVQFNVGAATIASGAKTTAQGFGGNGGSINISAPGAVDIHKNAILDTSGKVAGTYDTNVISISGGVVNNDGIIRANGAAKDLNGSPMDGLIMKSNWRLASNPKPPAISPGSGTGEILFGPPLEFIPSQPGSNRGGTLRLVATGQAWSAEKTIQNASNTVLSTADKSFLQQRNHVLSTVYGDVLNKKDLLAQGAWGQSGGTILVSATRNITNTNLINTSGKKGGLISLNSMETIFSKGTIESKGHAGTGGMLTFSYKTMHNPGKIMANGAKGGLIAFAGNANPSTWGTVQARGTQWKNGTIVTPQLNTVPSKQLWGSGKSKQPTTWAQTQWNEVLVHDENAVLLSRTYGTGNNTLTGRLANAVVRTVDNGKGMKTNTLEMIKHRANFVFTGQSTWNSTGANELLLDIDNANINPIFSRPNTLMVVNNGNITNNMHWSPGVNLVGPGSHDTVFALGGGHISLLSSGSIANNGFLLTRGLWSGGSINLAARGDIVNNKVILSTTFNKDLASAFAPMPGYISSHSGSTILKAMNNVNNNYRLNTNLAFRDIHPPLNSPDLIWPLFLNNGSIGVTNYVLAGNHIANGANGQISADALTYRNGQFGTENPAHTTGGITTLSSCTGYISNQGKITADGKAYYGFTNGQNSDGPRFEAGTTWSDLKPAYSMAGNIIVE